ncbi:VWA domain-containing protein [Rhodocaloribacter litoris]|uniref:vWA domain-containing protein n=1 Tax=Rhodocaloribacter litoris TaxID=2558931 RepID=UPI00141F3186|nr:VWA domain-containing protein [Rhodocaloribacter litoris]QXD14132.1 VWA domain-containing protein [Rhodocaloribacter litoris]
MFFRYSEWDEQRHGGAPTTFEKLFELFQQLLQYTAGDAAEALHWMTQLDQRYGLTDEGMGLGDFIEELKKRGYLEQDAQGVIRITPRTEGTLRRRSLEEIFTRLRKGRQGRHKTPFAGQGDERLPETRAWQFGDDPHLLDVTGTLSNAFRRTGIDDWDLREDDFVVHETDHHTSVATVLMIDLSHSMVLYGEDRITPARKTALALAELIMTHYPKDTLDIVAFGNDAWEVSVKDLPYLNVGPYYTNTRAGLQRARDILRRRKNRNKQIFLITDGKPSCHFENGRMYRNAFGLDRRIVNKVLDEAVICRREGIVITTFMIARDPYLQDFVRRLTEANRGRAYYASLDELGTFLFEDYIRNRRKTVR